MRPFPIAICFHKLVKMIYRCAALFSGRLVHVLVVAPFVLFCFVCFSLFGFFLAFGSSRTMTKRDSLLAGFTYTSSPMSMPRRYSWRSRSHGQPSHAAAPSNPDADPTASDAGPSIPLAETNANPSQLGTPSQTWPHPSQLLLIIRLRFFQDLMKKPIHSRWSWQKPVVSSTHTISSRFTPLKLTHLNRHSADLW